MTVIGLTGGIGSGKSTVAKIFESAGVPIFIADLRAHSVCDTDYQAIEAIKSVFGNNIYVDGLLDRKSLSKIVFNNKDLLKKLEDIVHPAVKRDFDKFKIRYADKKFLLLESAILIQSGFYKFVDFSVLVSAPENIRIQRVKLRDDLTEEEISRRIKNQNCDAQSLNYCRYCIINNNETSLISQVLNILND